MASLSSEALVVCGGVSTADMNDIWADFNAQTVEGYISLCTRGSQQSLAQLTVQPNDWVWLSDGGPTGARGRC